MNEHILAEGLHAIAKSIDRLSETIDIRFGDEFGHQLCMGIRKSIGGKRADDEELTIKVKKVEDDETLWEAVVPKAQRPLR